MTEVWIVLAEDYMYREDIVGICNSEEVAQALCEAVPRKLKGYRRSRYVSRNIITSITQVADWEHNSKGNLI